LRRGSFLQGGLQLTPRSVRRLGPARFAPPRGRAIAVVGGDESEEFLRQNALIRAAWGERVVPVCESVPGANLFEVLEHHLTDPGSRLQLHALRLLGSV
jgi:arylformamidase